MKIGLSLILWTTRIQKQFSLFVFVFIDSLVVSALQDAAVATRFPAKITSRVAFGLPYLLIELFYIDLPVVWTDGRARVRMVT